MDTLVVVVGVLLGVGHVATEDNYYRADRAYTPPTGYDDGPQIFRGQFFGTCDDDGIYYRDTRTFVFCFHGNSYVMPCSPGTKNGDYDIYEGMVGKKDSDVQLCDVNLVDSGYFEHPTDFFPNGNVPEFAKGVLTEATPYQRDVESRYRYGFRGRDMNYKVPKSGRRNKKFRISGFSKRYDDDRVRMQRRQEKLRSATSRFGFLSTKRNDLKYLNRAEETGMYPYPH